MDRRGSPGRLPSFFNKVAENMSKVTSIQSARDKKQQRSHAEPQHEGFRPCSPDLTICGDCPDNRAKNKCPRLKEWLAKRSS
jgi:hypothetical protein